MRQSFAGVTITADALHCESESIYCVVNKDGDLLFQLENNEPNAFEQAKKTAVGTSPLLPAKHSTANTDDSMNAR